MMYNAKNYAKEIAQLKLIVAVYLWIYLLGEISPSRLVNDGLIVNFLNQLIN